MGGVPRNVIYIVGMGARVYTCCANLHLIARDRYSRSAEPNETRGGKDRNARGKTHTLFGLPNPDNLIDPYGGQLPTITAPGNVRHCVWGRYLDVPWAKRREVGCLTETYDEALEKWRVW